MTDIAPLAVSIAEAVRLSGIGRSTLYKAIKTGELTIKKRGRRSIVEMGTLKAWLSGLPEGGGTAAH
jgi:hypothetical protein